MTAVFLNTRESSCCNKAKNKVSSSLTSLIERCVALYYRQKVHLLQQWKTPDKRNKVCIKQRYLLYSFLYKSVFPALVFTFM